MLFYLFIYLFLAKNALIRTFFLSSLLCPLQDTWYATIDSNYDPNIKFRTGLMIRKASDIKRKNIRMKATRTLFYILLFSLNVSESRVSRRKRTESEWQAKRESFLKEINGVLISKECARNRSISVSGSIAPKQTGCGGASECGQAQKKTDTVNFSGTG